MYIYIYIYIYLRINSIYCNIMCTSLVVAIQEIHCKRCWTCGADLTGRMNLGWHYNPANPNGAMATRATRPVMVWMGVMLW